MKRGVRSSKSHHPHKAQAAMEFLMTYGWAIFVVLMVIGALAYFGVLSPTKALPNRCLLPSGFGCDDALVNENSVTLAIRNGLDTPVTVTYLSVEGCTGNDTGIIAAGGNSTFTVDGCSNTQGAKFTGDINLTYLTDSTISHTFVGDVVQEVQAGMTLPPLPVLVVLSFREDGTLINQTDDTYLSADNPVTNYGAFDLLSVGQLGPHAHAIIKFPNLIGVGPGQVPAGVTLQSAQLTVHCFEAGPAAQAYSLSQSWVESEANWNDRSSGSLWFNPGADGPASHGFIPVQWDCSSVGMRTIDITSIVQEWVSGTSNNGLIVLDSDVDGFEWHSSEAIMNSNRPLLIVSYIE